MARVWKNASRFAANLRTKIQLRNGVTLSRAHYLKKTSASIISLGIAAVAPKPEAKLEVPVASRLSTEYLTKSASVAAVEQASTLISYIAIGLERAEKQYAEALFALVVLMEYKLQVLGHKSEEERIWNLILEARALVNEARQKKQDLEMMLMSAVNMVNAAAEVAYMAGEEFSGSCAGDRLNKVENYLKHSKSESENAEQRLREAEAKTVDVESKHAEEQKRKEEKEKEEREKIERQEKKKEEAVKSNTESVMNISDTSGGDQTDKDEDLIT